MQVRIIDATHQEFNGVVYHKNNLGYYCGKDCLLHREVWKFHNGDIPAGYHVHHRDDDKNNNQIENLQLLTKSAHHKLHSANKPKVEIVCPVCGKTFLTVAERPAKFCSAHCRNKKKYVSAQPVQKNCQECGKPFETYAAKSAKFCSKKCQRKNWLARIVKGTCAICGKPITFTNGQPRKTCSEQCEGLLMWKNRATKTKLVSRTCEFCGKEFHTDASKPSKFCSRNCRAQYQEKYCREIRKCVVCGKEFSIAKSSKNKCCSRKCGAKIHSKYVPQSVREEIRRLYVFGSTEFGSRALARKFGVSATTVLDIVGKNNG